MEYVRHDAAAVVVVVVVEAVLTEGWNHGLVDWRQRRGADDVHTM